MMTLIIPPNRFDSLVLCYGILKLLTTFDNSYQTYNNYYQDSQNAIRSQKSYYLDSCCIVKPFPPKSNLQQIAQFNFYHRRSLWSNIGWILHRRYRAQTTCQNSNIEFNRAYAAQPARPLTSYQKCYLVRTMCNNKKANVVCNG